MASGGFVTAHVGTTEEFTSSVTVSTVTLS
jgi:hypothetical protein